MAITAYTGLPGSGKSYSAVAFALLPAIQAGRIVVTNIPLNLDAIRGKWPAADVRLIDLADYALDNPERLQLDDACPPGALVALDELWRLWPSGLKTSAVPQGDKSFLAEHRHRVGPDGRSTDILLITQDLSQVAAFARALVDKTYITTKLDGIGLKSRAKVGIYQGAVTGHRGPESQHIRTSRIRYSADVWQFYRSHTRSETGAAGEEVGADDRGTIWRSPFFIALGLGLVVVVPFAWAKISSAFDPAGGIAADMPAPVAAPINTPRPSSVLHVESAPGAFSTFDQAGALPTPTPEPAREKYSTSWRLVGTVENLDSGRAFALVESAGGFVRLNLSACEPMPESVDLMCTHLGQLVHVATGHGYLSGTAATGGMR